MKGQGGGGPAKGGGKTRGGGGTVTIKKTKARQTKDLEGNVLILREALFEAGGKDKNVCSTIAPPFMKFDRNGLDLKISFETRLAGDDLDWAFNIVKDNMEDVYDASGYGWDDDDKMRELTEDGTRFLLVRDAANSLVAFTHFRFTVQGEVMDVMCGEPSLFVWDLHVEEDIRRKGLGKHLLMVLELIARQQKMRVISVPIQFNDEEATNWIRTMRGFAPDASLRDLVGFDADMEGFEVYSKILAPAAPRPPAVSSASTDAVNPPAAPTEIQQFPQTEHQETENAEASDAEDVLEISLNEAIEKLKELFIEKNGREPTSEELNSWELALSSQNEGDTTEETESTQATDSLTVEDTSLVDCTEEGDYIVVDHKTMPSV